MKHILLTLAIVHIAFAGLALTSCKNPQDTQRAVTLGSTALDILVAKKVLKPEDAALAKQTGQILITPPATGK